MINLKNIEKIYPNGYKALSDINMEIQEGEFIALLGPSGCGKTTTLNCVAGLLDVSSGTIEFGDKDVTTLPPRSRNIGMVFQSYALYPHLSIIDNIAFPLKQKKVDKAIRHEKARAMAQKLQIEHLLDRKPSQLSGGQQQRVALCRALVKQPDILLLDEPMSNLDARLKIEIREVIRNLHDDIKITTIIVTHDQEEAMALADRIAILDKGEIQQFDTPHNLYNNPKNLFVANFMGNPPMNFIPSYVNDEGKIIICETKEDTELKFNTETLNHAISLGVRPHEIMINFNAGIEVMVNGVENLGKELLVSTSLGNQKVRIMTSNMELEEKLRTSHKDNTPVYISFTENYLVFDQESGSNLLYV